MAFRNLTNTTEVVNLMIWEPVSSYAKRIQLGIHKIASA